MASFRTIRRDLFKCVIAKRGGLAFRKGGRKRFDDMTSQLIKLIETAKYIDDNVPEDENVFMHPDCYGADDHQNQEGIIFCGRCLAYSRELRERNRAIRRL